MTADEFLAAAQNPELIRDVARAPKRLRASYSPRHISSHGIQLQRM